MELRQVTSAGDWRRFLQAHPSSHLLQTWEWGELKAGFGWAPLRLVDADAAEPIGAQVLIRKLNRFFSFAYLPKGPVGASLGSERGVAFLAALRDRLRATGAAFLKIEPDEPVAPPALSPGFHSLGMKRGAPVQPVQTIVLDLEKGEQALLAGMRQKTRYNIRLAARKGLTVRRGDLNDLPLFQSLMEETGRRNRFGVHSLAYHRRAFELFQPDRVVLLIAEYQSEPIGGLLVFRQGGRAYYLFGASSNHHREKMSPYLLQWEAIRWAMGHGCRWYDLWGIPDASRAELKSRYSRRTDGLWGVYRFKQGFGGTLMRYAGAYDIVYRPLWYHLFSLLVAVRRRGIQM